MTPQPELKNRLLSALPKQDWEKMRSHFDEVRFSRGDVLVDAGEPFRQLYFPTAGVISDVTVFATGSMVEMATMGLEGMVNIRAYLGSQAPLGRQIVQVPGSALAISYDDFRHFEQEVPAFRGILLAYAQAFLDQVLQSVACNAVHSIQERVARWFLWCHDRCEGDTFTLTQEFLADMLGASRPIVNTAARTLQRAGLIHYSRGSITITDRAGLEEASCECYAIIRRAYEQRSIRLG
jgi:CRP-like cAMP-binding protein